MKWWLKLGLALILAVVIAILGISGFLGYSVTSVERVPIEENPTHWHRFFKWGNSKREAIPL